MLIFMKSKNCCWVINQNEFEQKIEDFLNNILVDRSDYNIKRKI